jgi:hypothetical protein
MPPEITLHDRDKALAELERIAQTLNQMSQWLGSAGEQRPAVMLEEALKNVVAAGWLMQAIPPGPSRPRTAGRRLPSMAHGTAADVTPTRGVPVRRVLTPGSPTPGARPS